MAREIPEWVGKTDDDRVPARVRRRVFDAHGGRCHITGREIGPADKWDLDHIVPLADGGRHCESNLAPALVEAHKAKTAQENATRAKVNRVRAKHIGARPRPRRLLPGSKGSGWKRTFNNGWVKE